VAVADELLAGLLGGSGHDGHRIGAMSRLDDDDAFAEIEVPFALQALVA
jgi:hypothetical protein